MYLDRLFSFFEGYSCCAFQLVPRERLAFDSSNNRLEEHDGEQLTIGKSLQPYLTQQPGILTRIGSTSFERKCDGRGDEIV